MTVEGVGAPTRTIRLAVNGQHYVVGVDVATRLIDVLRDHLALIGTKEGCSVGVCGTCTVIVNDQIVSSCLTFAVTLDGASVSTVEGLERDGTLHPLQEAFITAGGFQCGYCTPGQLVAASALLAEDPDPSNEAIQEGMLGNLCRCTGYYKIADSVRLAAKVLRENGVVPPSGP
jgi:carbon-monoxide dehydrogenase small subunit